MVERPQRMGIEKDQAKKSVLDQPKLFGTADFDAKNNKTNIFRGGCWGNTENKEQNVRGFAGLDWQRFGGCQHHSRVA